MEHPGRGAVEIAQDLLSRKLGGLGSTVGNGSVNNANTDDFDLYAQHFARSVEKITMEAIQDLIEHGAMVKKMEGAQKGVAETPGLVA